MPLRSLSLLPLAGAVLALTACGRGEAAKAPPRELDPAVIAALSDPIMIDPDLASQNRGNAAIVLGTFDAVPLYDISPDAVAAAQADAAQLAGGTIRTAPEPLATQRVLPPALTAGEVAAALPAGCQGQLRYDYAWAARLPAAMPVYPRGHVQEAAGSDGARCTLRAVIFVTPVAPGDIVDFYHTTAGRGGYRTQRRRSGEVEVLSGTRDGSSFVMRVRDGEDGLSRVELATRSKNGTGA